VQDGGLATQRVLRSTLGEVGPAAQEWRLRAPAVTVVGEVAALASDRSEATAGTWSVP
jgi:siroheme synthase